MHVAGFGGRELQHRQHVAAAIGRGGRVDDRAARLVAERRAVQALARGRRCAIEMREREPLLQAAQILRAGDDLLAGVAAFLKTDSAQRVPVGGLRHEQVGGGRSDDRNTGAYGQPLPCREARGAAYRGQAFPARRGSIGRDGDDIARSRECRDKPIVERRDSADGGGCAQCPADRAAGAGPADAQANALAARVDHGDARTQDEHAKALGDGFAQALRQQQLENRLAAAPNQEIGQHPPLGRAPCAVLGFARAECGNIVGELPLQKPCRVRPRDPQNRQCGQIANDRGVSRGNELAGWRAERGYAAAVEACAMRSEVIGPGWIHRGHLGVRSVPGVPAGHMTAPAPRWRRLTKAC